MNHKTAQQIKEENAIQNRIAQGIAEIRIARLKSLTAQFESGTITASEFLTMTDNIWQDEVNQALGR